MSDPCTLLQGDCFEVLQTLEADSVDSCVTDPPYGFGDGKTAGFMGKAWDRDVPSADMWRQVYRVLKPGAHLLSFFGTRTYHRGVVAIEDAGFEIRDQIGWLYGSGFPKSLDVSKAIDKAAGAEREVIGPGINAAGKARHHAKRNGVGDGSTYMGAPDGPQITAPATEAAKQWDGWGTALKPAWESIVVARKPLIGTVAQNVLEHGTGGLNIDGCRVGRADDDVSGWSKTGSGESENRAMSGKNYAREAKPDSPARFPANVIHDGSDEVLAEFAKYGERKSASNIRATPAHHFTAGNAGATNRTVYEHGAPYAGDTGTAARFFYTAKASKDDRNDGLDRVELVTVECSAWEDADQKAVLRVDTAPSVPRVIGVSGVPVNDASLWSTFLFGSDTTAPCPMAITSITETATSSTMTSPTLRWLRRSHTSDTIAAANGEATNGGSLAASAEPGTPSLTITSEWTVSARGVERAASPMQLRISASARRAADHPTVKPTSLMRYLVRLVTPKGGLVLDPFAGSGTTLIAAYREDCRAIGIELDPDYFKMAAHRIDKATAQLRLDL